MITVIATYPSEAHKTLEATVDADIRKFEEYFKGLGNDPLVRSEVAILKTYLHYKINGEKNVPQTGG